MKKISAILLIILTFCYSGVWAFEDVKPGDDCSGAVNVLAKLSVLTGDENNNFHPNDTITRAEFAAIMCRILGKAEEGKEQSPTDFTDVPERFWGSGYIKTAARLGVINGYGGGLFGPYDPVTYEQVVKMLVAALGYSEQADGLGGYPAGYLAIGYDRDITSGATKQAGETVERSQVAIMAYNALKTPVANSGGATLADANFPGFTKNDLLLNQYQLTWEAPALTDPVVINLGISDDVPELENGKDYLINLPETVRKRRVIIKGGRNVVLKGGHIELPAWDKSAEDSEHWGIYVVGGDADRIVHIEGVLIHCNADGMGDAMVINCPKGIVQIQNVRVENLRGDAPNMHADVIQAWGGVKELRVDRLTGYTAYQGLFLNADYNESGKFILKNMNLISLPEIAPKSGGYMLWLNTKDPAKPTDTELENIYIKPREKRSIGKTVWPDVDAKNADDKLVINGDKASWPGIGWVKGEVIAGVPENGDFVPVGVAGLYYGK